MVDDFHPDLRRIARFLPTGAVTPPLPLSRMFIAMFVALRAPVRPRGVEVVRLGDGVGVRVHRPPSDTAPSAALLWMHGGCYVIGCAAQDDKLCQRFARALGSS